MQEIMNLHNQVWSQDMEVKLKRKIWVGNHRMRVKSVDSMMIMRGKIGIHVPVPLVTPANRESAGTHFK